LPAIGVAGGNARLIFVVFACVKARACERFVLQHFLRHVASSQVKAQGDAMPA
jgi:hypothetical protein